MLAVLFRIKLWLSNLHLIIIFGVYNKWKTIILGVVFKNFEKFAFEKIFFVKSESKILKNSIFKKFYKSNCTFYYEISIWNDFSFHLMYILSILVKNYRFSKIYILKAENFLPWNEVTLEPHCGNILNQRMIFKDSIEEWICQMSLETISGEFWWKMGAYHHIKPLRLIQPPPVFGSTEEPGLIRVKDYIN